MQPPTLLPDVALRDQHERLEAKSISDDWRRLPGSMKVLGPSPEDRVLASIGAVSGFLQKLLRSCGGRIVRLHETYRPYFSYEQDAQKEQREALPADAFVSHLNTRLGIPWPEAEWIWEASVWTLIEKGCTHYPFLFSKFKISPNTKDSVFIELK